METAIQGLGWVLPPLSNSGIISIIWLYIALNRTPNIDRYWVGAVPKVSGLRCRVAAKPAKVLLSVAKGSCTLIPTQGLGFRVVVKLMVPFWVPYYNTAPNI